MSPLPLRHTVQGFLALRRTVADLARAVDFYCAALGFTAEARGNGAVLRLGAQRVELVEGKAMKDPVAAPGPDTRFQHIAIVAGDMDAALARLQRRTLAPITHGGPQTLPAATGGVTAYKFRDPDGHPLELLHFPPGIGDARWHGEWATGAPTLGIDHAALSVADIERSMDFYVNALGFRLLARQVNSGAAQARLDGLDDPQVVVVALEPASRPTPHLELLGYRKPAAIASPPKAGSDVVVFDAVTADTTLTDPDGHIVELRAQRAP